MEFVRNLLSTIFPAIIVILLVSACLPAKEDSFSLEGTRWELLQLGGEEILPATFISAEFREDGMVGGSSGCNSYSAPYEVEKNIINIGPSMGTLMACPDPIMEQENAYLKALESAKSYQLEDQNLVLADGEGTNLLVFEKNEQNPLEGAEWEAISYNNGKGAVVSVIIGSKITAVFGEDGVMSGSAGCNTYNAEFSVDGENITIGPAASTRKLCNNPEGIMEQEQAYMAGLETASTYRIENDRLDMFTDEGSRVGTFRKVP